MAKTITVFTADRFLYQKIRLSAPEGIDTVLGGDGRDSVIRLWDIDTDFEKHDGALRMSRTDPAADISIPFELDEIPKLVSTGGEDSHLTLSDGDKCAVLHGESIRLTEVEYSLLSAIYKRGGEYALREELLSEVWDGKADAGVINVYIHYLREKLEKRGEKIIISSRKSGYKIDEKYLRRNGNAQDN